MGLNPQKNLAAFVQHCTLSYCFCLNVSQQFLVVFAIILVVVDVVALVVVYLPAWQFCLISSSIAVVEHDDVDDDNDVVVV